MGPHNGIWCCLGVQDSMFYYQWYVWFHGSSLSFMEDSICIDQEGCCSGATDGGDQYWVSRDNTMDWRCYAPALRDKAGRGTSHGLQSWRGQQDVVTESG